MKPSKTYLSGKSVFIVSLIVIAVTSLTVYITGEHYHRTITENFYLSLSIIAFALFLFMTVGLYRGIGLKDDYMKGEASDEFPDFQIMGGGNFDIPSIDTDDGISGLLLSILFWIVVSIALIALVFLLELLFWFSVFILFAMLYWVFFRALKLVFSKAAETKGDMAISAGYAFMYTGLYTGWLFTIVYLAEILR